MSYCRGLKPVRDGSITFKAASYFSKASLPIPPKRFGHFDMVHQNWGMLKNDTTGDCVFAGAAHEQMVFGAMGGKVVRFTDKGVLSDYSSVTGYTPWNPFSDQGTDIAEAASYRRKTGVMDADGNRHRIDAYVSVGLHDTGLLASMSYLCGCVGIGLQLPNSAEDQFRAGQAWNYRGEAPGDGHYVPVVGRNSAGNFLVITYGRLHAITPDFYRAYASIALAYLSFESLNAQGLSLEGFHKDQLLADLADVGTVG